VDLKRILAVTDFSPLGDAAIRRAALLAAREDAELLVVHALPRRLVLENAFGTDGDLPASMHTVAAARLATLVESATQTGVRRVNGEITEGSAHRAVADTAESFNPDLLAIGAHGRGLLQQLFLGGTASRILTHAPCPVLVARREPAGDYRQALAAVDLGPGSEAVLHAALVVASQARITLFHAYQAPFEAKLRYKNFPEEDIIRHTVRAHEAAQRNMDALLADPELAGLDLPSRIVHGNPDSLLPEAAESLGTELIVAGRHGGSRLGEAVMGSTPRFLVYYAPCDVLVV
jgi:nucleotide-binding universal stress UspA family protein